MKLVLATFEKESGDSCYLWVGDWPLEGRPVLSLEQALCIATGLRPVVLRFAKLMEEKLRKHDEDRGSRGWINDDPEVLAERIGIHGMMEQCELRELFNAIERWRMGHKDGSEQVAREAADVANFAMMVADVVGGLKP